MVRITISIIGRRGENALRALILHRSGDDWERIGLMRIGYGRRYSASYQSYEQRVQEYLDSLPFDEVSII